VEIAVYLIAGTARALLYVVMLCFFVHSVGSWFLSEDHPVLRFTGMVTEPLVEPLRRLFERFGWFQGIPVDIAYTVTFLIVVMVGSFI